VNPATAAPMAGSVRRSRAPNATARAKANMASPAGARLAEANQDQRELAVWPRSNSSSGCWYSISLPRGWPRGRPTAGATRTCRKTDRPGESHRANVSAKGMPKRDVWASDRRMSFERPAMPIIPIAE
jgi:hypothetical protein